MKRKMFGKRWERILVLRQMKLPKKAFPSLRTKYVRPKKALKDSKRSGTDAQIVMKAENDMREYRFLSWLDNFEYERNNKCNLQNNEEDIRFLFFFFRYFLYS